MESLSLGQARRIALTANGLARPRPARAGAGSLAAMLERLSMVQIDSVRVLERAHYMPGFSRLGAYDPALLDKAAKGPRRKAFEYWGHEASLIRTELQPSLRWRMARARDGRGIYGGLAKFGVERRDYIDAVLAQISSRGPLAARELDGATRGEGGWWGWSDGKRALEWLFWAGFVTTRSRRGFERIYDLTERVLPDVAALPTPPDDEGQRTLLIAAAKALGVATANDLRLYWRIGPVDAAARLPELVEMGELTPVTVEGWAQPAFLARDAGAGRGRPKARALVSPFDPLLWERDRAERLFGFRYRIGIYTPVEKREHGYYDLPLLLGERIVGKLDLKADRATKTLIVHAAHPEDGCDPDGAAIAAAEELRLLAQWLELERIEVGDKGPLIAPIRAALAAV